MIQSVKIGKKQTNQGAMNFSNLLDAPAGKHGFMSAILREQTRIACGGAYGGIDVSSRKKTDLHDRAIHQGEWSKNTIFKPGREL